MQGTTIQNTVNLFSDLQVLVKMSQVANNKKAYNRVNMYCILKRYLYTMTRIMIIIKLIYLH